MLTRLSALLAVILVTSVAGVAPAAAYEPDQGGTFNVPKRWSTRTTLFRLVTHVERAIDATPAGETILISSFLFDREQSADALIAACKRGVSVRVILDSDIASQHAERLMKALNGDNLQDEDGDGVPDDGNGDGTPDPPKTFSCGTDFPGARVADPLTDSEAVASSGEASEDPVTWGGDRSYAKMCQGSCRGAGGNMHAKFYAFTRTGTAQNVVMVSSANLNKGGALRGWNDLYTMNTSPEVNLQNFEVYQTIHREMTDDDKADDVLREERVGPFTHRFFPLRNASRSNDPTLADLNKIGCRSSFGRTQVHVSQFYWADDRGIYLADKIVDLAQAGCNVSVIHAAAGGEVISKLRDAARRHQLTLYDSRWDFNRNGEHEIRTHEKYVLVKGQFGGDESAHMVMTGTQNWGKGSLTSGDDNTLNIALVSAWQDYIQNWNDVRRHSREFPNRS